MKEQIVKLIDKIIEDYASFFKITFREDFNEDQISEKVKEFGNKISWKEGDKYIKIISGDSVWGFIVNTDSDKKFKRGDILKAAGWSNPARNKARGNIFGEYDVMWTGPHYLR